MENVLADKAREYALKRYNQSTETRLVYHNFHLAGQVASLVREFAAAEAQDAAVPETAAWIFPLGYLSDYDQPSPKTLEEGIRFCRQAELSEDQAREVMNCLRGAFGPEAQADPASRILHDAVCAARFGPDFMERRPYKKLEQELFQGSAYNLADWNQLQLQELMQVRYWTGAGKDRYEPILAAHLLEQREEVEKYRKEDSDEEDLPIFRKFHLLEKKIPYGGIQTFFRTNYRNHINLSAIADNKANIMISVNAILISVIISAISYKNITETNPMVLMPAVIFLITGLTSLIFAVLSARPKVTQSHDPNAPMEVKKQNIIFFGNFVNMPLEDYEEAVDGVFREGSLLYGNLVRDLYQLGKVLDKKYRYLTISYNIFMVGFAATVITFLLALLF